MSQDPALAGRAIAYIESHLDGSLDLDTVARAMHYSRYHLHRVFSCTAGLTVHDYVLRRRMTEAARMLVLSGRPILDIAILSGYETQQAFSAAFKELYKLPPGLFRERAVFYPLQLPLVLNPAPALAGQPLAALVQKIRPARPADIPAWMELARLAIDGFPCWEEEAYLAQLRRAVRERRALILWDGAAAAGAMIFEPETGSIDFLAVHPQYRRDGVAAALLCRLAAGLPAGRSLCLTTFRAGDKADTGHRAACFRLGFCEGELLTEFGYPTQRFRLCPAKEPADG